MNAECTPLANMWVRGFNFAAGERPFDIAMLDISREAQVQSILARQHEWTAHIEALARRHRVLSTLPYRKVPFWLRAVQTVPTKPHRWARLTDRMGIPDPFLIPRLLRRARAADLVLLSGGERADLLYAAIASACPWVHTPHVIVDAHWQADTGMPGRLQRWLLRMSSRLVKQVQPHSREEIDGYADLFGITRSKLHAIPWSTSLLGHQLPNAPVDEGFILTGGHSFRDYDLFLAAAADCGHPVRIGISANQVTAQLQAAAEQHSNITLHTHWSNGEYLDQMARCRVFAMPIRQGLTRSTADQTILNAMHLGKIVVCTDSIGPRIYVQHGINGLLVAEPTSAAWAHALGMAFRAAAPCTPEMRANAAFDARVHFNETFRLARTLDAALAVINPAHIPLEGTERALPPT